MLMWFVKKRKNNFTKLHQLTDVKKKRLVLNENLQNDKLPVQQQSNGEESSISCHSSIPEVPVKLMNEGVNVCFFNAIVQSLVSIKAFRDYMEQSVNENRITSIEFKAPKGLELKHLDGK